MTWANYCHSSKSVENLQTVAASCVAYMYELLQFASSKHAS
jgi:hypothetical protein